jgi:hypothetical protein
VSLSSLLVGAHALLQSAQLEAHTHGECLLLLSRCAERTNDVCGLGGGKKTTPGLRVWCCCAARLEGGAQRRAKRKVGPERANTHERNRHATHTHTHTTATQRPKAFV